METTSTNPKPPEKLQLTAHMEITAGADTGDGKATGGVPRFSMVAYTGGAMRIAGWRYPVVVDLAGLSIPSKSRPIRFGHDANSGVGHSDSIRVDGGRLIATGVVSRDTAAAKEIVISAKNGFPWQASVGASVEQFEFVKETQSVLVNGREFKGPVNVVRRSTLAEISFVDLGADGNTSASVAAKHNQEIENMEDTVHNTNTSTGADPASPSATPRQVQDAAQAGDQGAPSRDGSRAQNPPATVNASADGGTGTETAADIRAAAVAEQERVAGIQKVCGEKYAAIAAQAIGDNWTVNQARTAVVREGRAVPPRVCGIHGHDDDMLTAPVLEAACMLTGRIAEAEKMYDERTLDAASRRFKGGIGLQELLLEAAWANGYDGRNFRDSRSVLRCAFGHGIQAGFSTVDIGGILSNVANKFLLDGFFSVERVWRNICAVRNVSDFKTVTSYRLIGKDQYEIVAPGGEIKHGTLGEEKYTNKADTYGLMLTIDRRDIINDDLGAITTVPRKMGRGSGLKINDVFWGTFLDNAAFFTAANKNLLTGVDTVLSIEGLSKAEKAFADLVDSDGKPIGIQPAIVLVPTALSAMATMLYKSLEIRVNGGGEDPEKMYPTANPHQNKFRAEVSRYLSAPIYKEKASETAWYLLADPSDLPVIEVAFLNGQESPTIETAEADFNVLGIQMRGYHDFGCALQDAKGGIRSSGAAQQ